MADLVLVRHAATSWSGRRYCGRSDPPLNRAGISAAATLAADLRTQNGAGARIVSSPRRRALQTARVIGSAFDASPIEVDDRWAETDFGVAEGLTYDELALVAPDIADRLATGDVDIDWPGGETVAGFVARVEAAWTDLEGHPGPALVVTHGGPIRIALALATGRPVREVALPDPAAMIRLLRDESHRRWRVDLRR